MKVESTHTTTHSEAPDDTGMYTLSEANMTKIARMFTRMYTDTGSPVREYISNARTAQKNAGVTSPIIVSIEHHTEGDILVTITDKGTGMSWDTMVNVMFKVGESTNDQDEFATGGFGVGAKSALSISPSYFIATVKDGEKSVVYTSLTDEGIQWDRTAYDPNSDEPNGTTVSIPLTHQQLNPLLTSIRTRLLPYYEPDLVEFYVDGGRLTSGFTPLVDGIRIGDTVLMKRSDMRYHDPAAIVDGAPYQINFDIEDMHRGFYPAVMYSTSSKVTIPATREGLESSAKTLDTLSEILGDTASILREMWLELIAKDVPSIIATLNDPTSVFYGGRVNIANRHYDDSLILLDAPLKYTTPDRSSVSVNRYRAAFPDKRQAMEDGLQLRVRAGEPTESGTYTVGIDFSSCHYLGDALLDKGADVMDMEMTLDEVRALGITVKSADELNSLVKDINDNNRKVLRGDITTTAVDNATIIIDGEVKPLKDVDSEDVPDDMKLYHTTIPIIRELELRLFTKRNECAVVVSRDLTRAEVGRMFGENAKRISAFTEPFKDFRENMTSNERSLISNSGQYLDDWESKMRYQTALSELYDAVPALHDIVPFLNDDEDGFGEKDSMTETIEELSWMFDFDIDFPTTSAEWMKRDMRNDNPRSWMFRGSDGYARKYDVYRLGRFFNCFESSLAANMMLDRDGDLWNDLYRTDGYIQLENILTKHRDVFERYAEAVRSFSDTDSKDADQ